MLKLTRRPAEQAIEILRSRAVGRKNPFVLSLAVPEPVNQGVEPMSSAWVAAFVSGAEDFAERAEAAEAGGQTAEARDLWLQAYDSCHIARYPTMDTDEKRSAYRRGLEYFDRYLQHVPSFERIVLSSRYGRVPALKLTPPGSGSGATLVAVGGLDVWKEDLVAAHLAVYVEAGFTVLALDSPGTGEMPIAASPEVDGLWDDVLDQISGYGLDSANVSVMGISFGGYWAARIAHTHASRLRSAVTHGGPVHLSFTEEWFNQWVERGEYPVGFSTAFMTVTRSADVAELEARHAELSLQNAGLLDGDCCALLAVNGMEDKTVNPEDMQLLLRHGMPKSARFYPGGHMGLTPTTLPTIAAWLAHQAGLDSSGATK